jgi:hypothetical protein
MRTEIYVAALILFAEQILAGGALADTRPTFSITEERTIARNELLRVVVDDDPWLVRKILDMLRGSPQARTPSEAADPDLVVAPRDWQGMVEWNELIKRARAEKAARNSSGVETRSSEGTVEMLDWMRRAKAKKAQQP